MVLAIYLLQSVEYRKLRTHTIHMIPMGMDEAGSSVALHGSSIALVGSQVRRGQELAGRRMPVTLTVAGGARRGAGPGSGL